MRYCLLLVGAALLGNASIASAQNSRDILQPGYVLIRVILDSGVATPSAPGFPGGPGGGFPGGEGDGEYGSGGFGSGGYGPGGPPMGPGSGFPGAGGAPKPGEVKSIYVVAPFTSIRFKQLYSDRRINQTTNPVLPFIKTKYGSAFLYHDDTSIQVKPIVDTVRGVIQPSLELDIKERYRKWATNRTLDPIYELTIDALAIGMTDEAFKFANETLDLLKIMVDKNPPQKVLDFAKAWGAVSDKIEAPAKPSDDAENWRARLSAAAVKSSKHYAIVYWGERRLNPAELDRRLEALEENFKAFYLWHALQGITLKVPEKQLVAILADRVTDVNPLRNKLDGLPIYSDCFYSPSHDVLVLAPERMDQIGAAFSDVARASYKNGWSRDELLKGVPSSGQRQEPGELARMMTLALVDKIIEAEMDHSAVSREACRQLYVASGLLPQNVQLPDWLNSGLSSFLQHPKGPFFTKDSKGNSTMVAGLAFGYGSPNYIMHRQFRDLDRSGELNPKPEVLLRNVLTDQYFEAIKAGQDIDPPPAKPVTNPGVGGPGSPGAPGGGFGGGPAAPNRGGRNFGGGPPMGSGGGPPMGSGEYGPMGPGGSPGAPGGGVVVENEAANQRATRQKLQTKADSTAWALVYYLSRSRMYGMQKFYAEIRRMPRDLRLNETAILNAFCQSFNLMDKQKPDQIDEAAFKDFAETWLRSIRTVPVYGLDVEMSPTATPSGPGGAGGAEGFGGTGGAGLPGGGRGIGK